MARWLRQSTSADVPIGPFVDQGDGFTAETTLTLTQPDIRLKKNAAAWAQKNAAQTLSHEENGYYEVTLDATDTNTLGLLRLAVNEAGALPVFEDFLVVPANVWDSFFSTDLLQIDVAQWLGTNAATPTVAGVPEVDLTHWRGDVPTPLASGKVQSLVTEFSTEAITDSSIGPSTGLKSIRTGTAQAGSNNSITLDAAASSVTDFYKGTRIHLHTSTGAGQSRLCVAYNGTTKVASVEPDWITNPGSGSGFAIRPNVSTPAIATGGIASTSFAAGAINAAAMAADMDSYTTRSWIGREGATADKYIVQWFKNGQLVTSGITVPLISVFDDTGVDLIAETAMTEIGSRQCFKFIETTNTLTAGEVYIMEVKATINGLTRIDRQPITRDSV